MTRTPEPPIIRASIFRAFSEVVCGLGTRIGAAHSFLGIPEERLAIPLQVHGNRVERISKPGRYERCDALVTGEADVYLTVSVADCMPIFLYDPVHRVVGVAHAGWRGCVHRIVERTISALAHDGSADPCALRVFIGPSARVCCYEVRDDVASQFEERFLHRTNTGRLHLDMVSAANEMLIAAGVRKENIEISPYCTICTPHLFHSYRRDGARAGRMLGIIGLQRIDF